MSNEEEANNPIHPDEVFPEGFTLPDGFSLGHNDLNDQGVSATVASIYGHIASPTMLRLLSNDPFTMSNETLVALRDDLFGAAHSLVGTIEVLQETPEGGFDASDFVMLRAASELLDAVGGLQLLVAARLSGDRQHAETLRAMLAITAVSEGLAVFKYTFTDTGSGVEGACTIVPVSEETDGL